MVENTKDGGGSMLKIMKMKIIEMVKKTEDEEKIRIIYRFVKKYLEVEE